MASFGILSHDKDETNKKILEYYERAKLPLSQKIKMSKERIRDFYEQFEGNVIISFSGGKDSTVLVDLICSMYPEVELVFSNTGLEYPEIISFVKWTSKYRNVKIVRPKKNFKWVLENYGYPVISKIVSDKLEVLQNPTDKNENLRRLYLMGIKSDGTKTKSERSILNKKYHYLIGAPFKISGRCCNFIKKQPLNDYQNITCSGIFLGMTYSEGYNRRQAMSRQPCNNYDKKRSNPLSFWTDRDIWEYIKYRKIEISNIYKGSFYKRTGCMFCMFGVEMEINPNRFQKMYLTHRKHWDFCINTLGIGDILNYIGVPYKYKGFNVLKK
jgi:3'-phosphoadenosine 5'-phosphosulfate sulfotransferase (PAPS reductase)/FAD synthetase